MTVTTPAAPLVNFPREHVLLTFMGDGWGQQEEWQTSLRVDSATLPTDAQLDTIAAAFDVMHRQTDTGISPAVRFWGVKAARIGPDGRYPADGVSRERFIAVPTAGGGPSLGFPQITLVATLTTALRRGKGSVGRMYLPAFGRTVATDGRIPASEATAIGNRLRTFLNAVNAAGVGPVTVFGRSAPAGTAQAVTGIRIGRVVDTQRRRRESIPEEYVEVSLGG